MYVQERGYQIRTLEASVRKKNGMKETSRYVYLATEKEWRTSISCEEITPVECDKVRKMCNRVDSGMVELGPISDKK